MKKRLSNFKKWTNEAGISMKTKGRLSTARSQAGMSMETKVLSR
jgi:hypothetical protein